MLVDLKSYIREWTKEISDVLSLETARLVFCGARIGSWKYTNLEFIGMPPKFYVTLKQLFILGWSRLGLDAQQRKRSVRKAKL